MKSSLVLINLMIYDFEASNLRSKPFGLLCLTIYFRCLHFKIHLINCMYGHHPGVNNPVLPHGALKV